MPSWIGAMKRSGIVPARSAFSNTQPEPGAPGEHANSHVADTRLDRRFDRRTGRRRPRRWRTRPGRPPRAGRAHASTWKSRFSRSMSNLELQLTPMRRSSHRRFRAGCRVKGGILGQHLPQAAPRASRGRLRSSGESRATGGARCLTSQPRRGPRREMPGSPARWHLSPAAVAPTLQHSTMIGPSNPAAFSVRKTAAKVHLARAELNHHVALGRRAILRAEAGDVCARSASALRPGPCRCSR